MGDFLWLAWKPPLAEICLRLFDRIQNEPWRHVTALGEISRTRGDLKPERQRSSYHLEILVNVPLTNTFISATRHGHRGIFYATPKKNLKVLLKRNPLLYPIPRNAYAYALYMYHISGRASRFLVTANVCMQFHIFVVVAIVCECVVFFSLCVWLIDEKIYQNATSVRVCCP